MNSCRSTTEYLPKLRKILALVFVAAAFHGSSACAALVYDGFNYNTGDLNGQGSTSTGLAGNWAANTSADVADSDLTYGNLLTSGRSIGNLSGGSNNFGGSRVISADFATPGLLNDGSELWFSVIMGYGAGGNRTNSRLVFVLGDVGMNTANFRYNYTTAGATGLGVTLGRFGSTNGNFVATEVLDTTFGNSGFAGNVFGTGSTGSNPTLTGASSSLDYTLVVGRITWGASSDTIDIYLPDTNLNLGPVHSTLSVNVNQSGYDTISFSRGDVVVLDEIRFGASFAEVAPATPVPEPSSLVLLACGAIGVLLFRKRSFSGPELGIDLTTRKFG